MPFVGRGGVEIFSGTAQYVFFIHFCFGKNRSIHNLHNIHSYGTNAWKKFQFVI